MTSQSEVTHVGWGWKLACGFVTLALVPTAALAAILSRASMPEAIGAVVGAAVIWPGIVVLLFGIARRFRSPRNRFKVWFFASSLFLVGNLALLLGALSAAVQR